MDRVRVFSLLSHAIEPRGGEEPTISPEEMHELGVAVGRFIDTDEARVLNGLRDLARPVPTSPDGVLARDLAARVTDVRPGRPVVRIPAASLQLLDAIEARPREESAVFAIRAITMATLAAAGFVAGLLFAGLSPGGLLAAGFCAVAGCVAGSSIADWHTRFLERP
jgi:hypothetical protein